MMDGFLLVIFFCTDVLLQSFPSRQGRNVNSTLTPFTHTQGCTRKNENTQTHAHTYVLTRTHRHGAAPQTDVGRAPVLTGETRRLSTEEQHPLSD